VLTGDLVVLRPLDRPDYPALTRWANDVELEVLGGGAPPRPRSSASTEELWDGILAAKTGASFGIEADGVLIGHCGLFNVDDVARTAELGIGIGERPYWGRGYGRDAVAVLVRYGFRHLNLHRIWLRVHATNERAIRAYAAAGFVEEGRLREHVWTDGRHVDLVQMGVLRRELRDAADPAGAPTA
jgi:RimJ/RimL family protein N-acetyltransferase